jgi:hypothetical protein
MILFLILAAPVVLLAGWLIQTSRAAVESPTYHIVRTDGKMEVRDYPRLNLASTPLGRDPMNNGFGRLFRFITGSNKTKSKIAMTTPVLIETKGENRTMSFILPHQMTEKFAPQPVGGNVTLGHLEATRFAVFRFHGGRTERNESEAVRLLREWLNREKLSSIGDPFFAYYDPPWTPVFLRRNEVLLRVTSTP